MMTPNLQTQDAEISHIKWWALHSRAQLPWQGTSASAGYDLYSVMDVLNPLNQTQVIPISLEIEIPPQHFGQIAAQSSLALQRIQIMAGVFDSDYRGKIKVILHNVSPDIFQVKAEMQVAQIIIIPCIIHNQWI